MSCVPHSVLLLSRVSRALLPTALLLQRLQDSSGEKNGEILASEPLDEEGLKQSLTEVTLKKTHASRWFDVGKKRGAHT